MPSTPGHDEVPLRADAARNRKRILAAARELVAAGDLSPGYNELARRAEVGVGTVYRHFPEHRVLLEALVETHVADFTAIAEAALAEPDPVAGLEHALVGTIRLGLEDPSVGVVMASGNAKLPRIVELLRHTGEMLDQLLARGHEDGVIREDVDADDLRRLLYGLQLAARSGADPEGAARRYVALLLTALTARQG